MLKGSNIFEPLLTCKYIFVNFCEEKVLIKLLINIKFNQSKSFMDCLSGSRK